MKRGRPPKPESLKKLTASGRKITRDLPSPAGAPPMPKRLMTEQVAVEKWQELVPILLALKTLTVSDGEALATLCEVYAASQACLAQLRALGPVIETDLGGVKPNPAGTLYRGLVALQSSLMSDFGLTPTSRVRLGSKPEEPEEDRHALVFAG